MGKAPFWGLLYVWVRRVDQSAVRPMVSARGKFRKLLHVISK